MPDPRRCAERADPQRAPAQCGRGREHVPAGMLCHRVSRGFRVKNEPHARLIYKTLRVFCGRRPEKGPENGEKYPYRYFYIKGGCLFCREKRHLWIFWPGRRCSQR